MKTIKNFFTSTILSVNNGWGQNGINIGAEYIDGAVGI